MSEDKTIGDIQKRCYDLELSQHCWRIDTLKADIEQLEGSLVLAVENRECFLLRESVPMLAKYGGG